MKFNELKKQLVDNGYEEILLFDNPSYVSAFIGVSDDGKAIYDFDLMVEYLVQNEGIDDVEAIEFIEYNTARSLCYYENAPIIKYNLN